MRKEEEKAPAPRCWLQLLFRDWAQNPTFSRWMQEEEVTPRASWEEKVEVRKRGSWKKEEARVLFLSLFVPLKLVVVERHQAALWPLSFCLLALAVECVRQGVVQEKEEEEEGEWMALKDVPGKRRRWQ